MDIYAFIFLYIHVCKSHKLAKIMLKMYVIVVKHSFFIY